MNSKELALKLHQHFNGDTYTAQERFKENNRWRYRYFLEPYTDERRLRDSTYQIVRAEDGCNSIVALTYQDLCEALQEILGD